MSDEEVRLKFYLDSKEALEGLNKMSEKISSIGESKNLSGLISSFASLAGPIFIAGAALLAVKKALDFTMEGEALIKVHNTFESLSEQAGLSAGAIEAGMKKATKGMVDTDDAIKSANKAIIQLGSNARKIPEIMDLARRAGKIFGVETLDAFEAISQTIATGSTRQLRQLGIIVDSGEAYRKYAKSIGVTVNALSEQGKQTALMNAILAKGDEKFKESANSAETLTGNTKKLGVQFKELGDTVAEITAKKFGGFFAAVTKGISTMVGDVNDALKGAFGNTAQKVESEFNVLNKDIAFFTKELEKLKAVGSGDSNSAKVYQEALDKAQARLSTIKELNEQKEIDSIHTAPIPEQKAGESEPGVDKEKQTLIESKFQRELLVLKEARLKSAMSIETDALAFTQQLGEEEVLIVDQYNARIEEIRAKGDRGEEMTKEQSAELIMQIEEEKKNKVIEFERQKEEASLQVYENQLRVAKTTSAGIIAGFKQQGMIAKQQSQDYGKQGVAAFNMVNTGAKKFFIGLGEGSKDASQLMKEFLFGVLADYAEQSGSVLLAEGIGTYQPIKVAQGGALLALSGLIRGLAGGGGGSSGSSGAGAGGGSLEPSNTLEKPQLDETQKKSVTIQVQGNYFETEQTKTRLTEMIRESSDATDYKFQQIGVK